MRAVRAAVAGVLALAASAVPAVACSGPPETEAVRWFRADVVFAGTVVGREDPVAPGAPASSGDPIAWTFAVDATRRGEPATTRIVTSARESATRGYAFRMGVRYAVFATADGAGGLSTGEFSGTRPLAPREAPPVYASPGLSIAAASRFRGTPSTGRARRYRD